MKGMEKTVTFTGSRTLSTKFQEAGDFSLNIPSFFVRF